MSTHRVGEKVRHVKKPEWGVGTVTKIETVTRTVIITFNGTATPPATVNGEPFTINLAQRAAQRR